MAVDTKPEPTEAMILGSAVDCLTLTPDLWGSTMAERPDADGRTREGKAILAAFDPGGRTVIRRKAVEQAQAIAAAVLSHPSAGRMVAMGEQQVSLIWTDPATGVRCKARLDMVLRGRCLADLKVPQNGAAASSERWGQYVKTNGLDYQAAMYHDGWLALTGEDLPWLWFCAPSAPPYIAEMVATYEARPSWLDLGRKKYRRALRLYAWCLEMDQWPGYPEDPVMCDPPLYALRLEEEDET